MASEIVTPLIWEVGAEAYKDRAADGCYPDTGAFTVALQAVAPLIRRAALEEAAKIYDRRAEANAREALWGSPLGSTYTGLPDGLAKPLNRAAERYFEAVRDATAIRALAKEPGR